MKAQLAESIEMVPESYQDDSFDIVVRDTHSIAVFWDLAVTSQPAHKGARLSLQISNQDGKGETETLILHYDAGHMIVPLAAETSRNYLVQLGWSDVNGFSPITSGEVELPPIAKASELRESLGSNLLDCTQGFRGSVFLPLRHAVERRGFRPAPEL